MCTVGGVRMGRGLKDRQQEAERGLRYLTLFASYFMYTNIQYIK